MSSPLFVATCVARHATVVDIELEPTPAISPHFPFSSFFAFALLHESASTRAVRPGTSPDVFPPELAGALASELGFDEVLDHSCRDSPERRALAARYIRDVGYVSARGWTPSTPLTDGLYRGAVPAPESRAQMDHLESLVRAGTTPAATLRIEVTEPRWCSHLEPGMSWDVYAFDDDAGLFA